MTTTLFASLDTFWADLARDFQQTDNPGLRKAAAIQIGVLKEEHDQTLRHKGDRTIREQALINQARATLPIIAQLLEEADADQLRDVIEGMVAALPSDCAWHPRSASQPPEDLCDEDV